MSALVDEFAQDAGAVQSLGVEVVYCGRMLLSLGVGGRGLGGVGPAGRGGDVRVVRNLPDRRGGGAVAEPSRFTLNLSMTPPRVLPGESQHERLGRGSCRQATDAAICGVIPLAGHESGVPGEHGVRRNGKASCQR